VFRICKLFITSWIGKRLSIGLIRTSFLWNVFDYVYEWGFLSRFSCVAWLGGEFIRFS